MAQSTLTPDSKEEQDAYGDPTKTVTGLSAAEAQVAHDKAVTDQMEGQFGNSSDEIEAREKAAGAASSGIPYEPGEQQNSRQSGASSDKKNPIKFLNTLKKGGPVGGLVGLFIAVLGLLTSFTPLMPIHVYQQFVEKFNDQNASYTIRTNKVMNAKLTKDVTAGVCTTVVNIRCKFSRPSNNLLKNLEKQGIQALDGDGKVIKPNGIPFGNDRPASFSFKGGAPIAAADFVTEINKKGGSEFGAAFSKANKTILQTFSPKDRIWKIFARQYGVDKRSPVSPTDSKEDINKKIGTGAAGDDGGTKAAVDAKDENQAKTLLKKIFGDAVTKEATKVGESGKSGNALGIAAGVVCAVAAGPGIAIDVERAYEIAQLIKLTMPYLTIVNEAMAGSSKDKAVSAFADKLTQTDTTGKSALDSAGMRYVFNGDIAGLKSKEFQKYVPGAQSEAIFGGAASILSSDIKRNICAGATSPITGLVVNVALGAVTFGIAPLVNVAVSLVTGAIISTMAGKAIEIALEAIDPKVYLDLATAIFGDSVTDAKGQDFGNAIAGGGIFIFNQLASHGFNMPLTKKQKLAYDNLTNQVNQVAAEQDRASRSPFDATSNNTFLGNIVTQLIPMYGKLGSLTSALSSFSTIASTSVSGVFGTNTYAASIDTARTNSCEDPRAPEVTCGGYGEVAYGIPPQYLDLDPNEVLDALIEAGQVDETTGEPIKTAGDFVADGLSFAGIGDSTNSITSLYKWVQLCTNGDKAQAQNCIISDDNSTEGGLSNMSALYAVYSIDHRVQQNMDDDNFVDPAEEAGAAGGATAVGDSGEIMPAAAPAGWTRVISQDFLDPAAVGQFGSVYPGWNNYDGNTSGHSSVTWNSTTTMSVTDGKLDMHSFMSGGTPQAGAITPQKPGETTQSGQLYGRYSIRYRADPGADGFKLAYLLWPSTGDWNEGEIDFPEGTFGEALTYSSHDVQGNPVDQDWGPAGNANIDDGVWHTTTIIWQPGSITFTLDGNPVKTITDPRFIPTTPMRWDLQHETPFDWHEKTPPASADGHVYIDWMTQDALAS